MRERLPRWLLLVLSGFFCLVFPFALIGLALNIQPPVPTQVVGSGMLFIEGSVLIVAGIVLCGYARALLAAVFVIVLSYGVEALGVNTGIPFGVYRYTAMLQPQLPGGVPLPVMFAWVLIVFGAYALVKRSTAARRGIGIGTALLGAVLAVMQDLAIEPVAAHVVFYWQWLAAGRVNYYGIPLANFVAWFVVTFMLLLLVDMVFGWGNGQGQHEPGAWNAEQERGRMGRMEQSGKMERSGGDRWMSWMSEMPWLSQRAVLVPRILFSCSLLMFGLVDLTHRYYWGAGIALCAGLLICGIWGPHVFSRHD